ncbi:MAG: hypothetical protein AABW65_00675 [Nanoarchaeota archaeon]
MVTVKKINFLHLICGLIFLAVSIFLLLKFHQNFRYLLESTLNIASLIKFIMFLLSALFGVSYIYYGLNSNEIDKKTNASLIILLFSVIISLSLKFVSLYYPSQTIILLSFYILAVGIISSLILLLLPIYKNFN